MESTHEWRLQAKAWVDTGRRPLAPAGRWTLTAILLLLFASAAGQFSCSLDMNRFFLFSFSVGGCPVGVLFFSLQKAHARA